MDIERIRKVYGVVITEEQARRLEAIQRQAKGPPYRMTFDFPPPVLSDEEMAKELAQAQYDDDMGIEPDPLTYTTLRAQTPEAARIEAEMRWRNRRHAEAIGYAIWCNEWSCVYSFTLEHGRNLVAEIVAEPFGTRRERNELSTTTTHQNARRSAIKRDSQTRASTTAARLEG